MGLCRSALVGADGNLPRIKSTPQALDIDSGFALGHCNPKLLVPRGVVMSKTLTRMDLSEAVFREVGLSRNESAQLVETVLQHMSDALVEGEFT